MGMFVTFALTCYNQECFIRDAVRAAFAQDYEPLEIIISDNHSTDATFDIVQEEVNGYVGSHSIRVIRQDENIGWEIFPRTSDAAHGEFVVGAHGDDISYPDRTRRLVEAWQATNASLLSSNAEIIDARSHLLSFLRLEGESRWFSPAELAKGYTPYMHGATLAWHPDVFRRFGPLDNLRLHAAYDHVLPFRAGLLNGSYYVSQTLLRWRVHGKNFGLEHADRTRGALVQAETNAAYDLGARICMLNDLDYLIKNHQSKNDLSGLRDLLVEEILSLVGRWSYSRNKLYAEGIRPTWMSQAEMEGRVDYSKGYFDRVDLGPRVMRERLRQLTARILRKIATF
jgi:glycosyltransferase involved in cell wall biosynthesis